MSDDGQQRVAIGTLGCKVNQCESSSLQGTFAAQGAVIVPFSRPADIYVINTCAVTAKAAFQSRQMIRRALKTNPEARIVVTGCYAQVAADELMNSQGQPLQIIGNDRKNQLVTLALHGGSPADPSGAGLREQRHFLPLPVSRQPGRTRAYLKIQDGCNCFCSYCIVPYARGRSRSLPQVEALAQAAALIGQGAKELIVTGIHLGAYGQDLAPATSLVAFLRELTRDRDTVRFRLSSLEPVEITIELIDLMGQTPALMPHLHIPLQSGDDGILARMKRRYRSRDFVRIVTEVVRLLPDAAIGADVLVGFPGEEEEHFNNTRLLLEDLPIAYLHVFPYSKRPGTVAAAMDGQLPAAVKEERAAIMRGVDHRKRTAFYGRFVGSTRPVLAEGARKAFKLMRGFTDNYIPVHFDAPVSTANTVLSVTLERLMDTNVFGSVTAAGMER